MNIIVRPQDTKGGKGGSEHSLSFGVWAALVLVVSAVGVTSIYLLFRWVQPIPQTAFLDAPDFECERAHKPKSLLIFVHGWNGDPQETWKLFPKLICNDARFSRVDVLVMHYPTYMHRRNLYVPQIAKFLNDQGKARGWFAQYQKIAIISHSLGGLVSRELAIIQALENAPRKPGLLIDIATPHLGADPAPLAVSLGISKQLAEDASRGSGTLRRLNDQWGILKPRARTYCFASPQDIIVSEDSARNPCDEGTSYPGGNHQEIVKPRNAKDPRYELPTKTLLEFF